MKPEYATGPLLCLLLAALLAGCASLGPGTIVRDRSGYGDSITESWKRQLLLNIVKIRYVEPLFFVDVGDIVAGYSLETSASVSFTRSWFDSAASGDSSTLEPGISSRYTDRPTITYRPMTGVNFLRGVMSPIPVANVLAGLDSGVSAKFLIRLVVRSINGVHNTLLQRGQKETGQDFIRVVTLLQALQQANALHMSTQKAPKGKTSRPRLILGGGPADEDRIRELQRLLGLDASRREYEVLAQAFSVDGAHIAIKTFSLMQVLAAVAARVDVPEEDLAAQLAIPGMAQVRTGGVLKDVRVRCAPKRPAQAYATVKSHGHWFWVDDADLATKRVFSFLMLVFTLMESGNDSPPVQITIPAQ